MDIFDMIRDQFLDVVEFEDKNNKLVVAKFARESGNNEIKQGSRLIVREGQYAVFVKSGQLADVFSPGSYVLNTDNMPILSTLQAFPYMFMSPIISELYFVSTKQFLDNKWAVKNPIMKRDRDFNMVRIRAFGKYSFRICDVVRFMQEIFGSLGRVMTYDIVEYLASLVEETFAGVVGSSEMSILDLAAGYRSFGDQMQEVLNKRIESTGIRFSDIVIENISLPDEVEKLIDEQSGIGMAKGDMNMFMQYHTARAMRDAAVQDSGLAGVGAGIAIGQTMAGTIQNGMKPSQSEKSMAAQLREMKSLLDEGILTQEEFDQEKKRILENR